MTASDIGLSSYIALQPEHFKQLRDMNAGSIGRQEDAFTAFCADDRSCSLVKGNERIATQFAAFEFDDAVCKIAASFQERKSLFYCRSINDYALVGNQKPDSLSDVHALLTINLPRHPHEFAQRCIGYENSLRGRNL